MDKFRAAINVKKIEVNDEGEYITLNFDDQELPDKFIAMQGRYEAERKRIIEEEQRVREQASGDEDGMRMALYALSTEFSRFCVRELDGLIGEGACKKIFGVDVPAFELFGDLFDLLTPYFEDGFKARATRISGKYSAARTGNV